LSQIIDSGSHSAQQATEPNQLGEGQAQVYIGVNRRSMNVEQRQQGRDNMKLHAASFLVGVLASATAVAPTAVALAADQGQSRSYTTLLAKTPQ
jgi:hypothetical protein